MVIKTSGVDYDGMTPDDMVVVDLNTSKTFEGKWKLSSGTATHFELYRRYPNSAGVVHMYSVKDIASAQAGRPIPALGTTHAVYFYGDIPCTRELTRPEVEEAYELNTAKPSLR